MVDQRFDAFGHEGLNDGGFQWADAFPPSPRQRDELPATTMATLPAPISPWVVSTPVTRRLATRMPVDFTVSG